MSSSSRPKPFSFGSATSAAGGFIGSYRRSQFLVAASGSVVVTEHAFPFTDEEAAEQTFESDESRNASGDEDGDGSDGGATPTVRDHVAAEFFPPWHEDDMITDPGATENELASEASLASFTQYPQYQRKHRPEQRRETSDDTLRTNTMKGTDKQHIVDERTRLLQQGSPPSVSFSPPPLLRIPPGAVKNFGAIPETVTHSRAASDTTLIERPKRVRRPSSISVKSYKNIGGKSTYGQTLFNAIAILVGIGMLSEPIAFAYAGWIGGTILIIAFGLTTCYTAKILAHIILSDPQLRSYADIGRKAFGPRSNALVSTLFCSELFAVSVVLITLYADSLHTILPQYSSNTYKLWGVLVLIPTLFMPLSLLSYASIIGVLSTVMIIAVVFIDGFTKTQAPGSLWDPAPTSLEPLNFTKLGVALGLFMAGLSGHAVIPSLARDMVDPRQFDSMINWAFGVATVLYGLIGVAGYLMFGNSVSDEVSVDLLNTPGYNVALNKATLWMLVISPLTKFALATRPVNITLESIFGIDTTALQAPSDHESSPNVSDKIIAAPTNLWSKRVLTVIERILFLALAVGVSIAVPEFSTVMAFLGSFSAFVLCVIGPISAKVALAGKCGLLDGLLLVLGVSCAAWGTWSAFASA